MDEKQNLNINQAPPSLLEAAGTVASPISPSLANACDDIPFIDDAESDLSDSYSSGDMLISEGYVDTATLPGEYGPVNTLDISGLMNSFSDSLESYESDIHDPMSCGLVGGLDFVSDDHFIHDPMSCGLVGGLDFVSDDHLDILDTSEVAHRFSDSPLPSYEAWSATLSDARSSSRLSLEPSFSVNCYRPALCFLSS